jgi:hypothetical protein
MTSPVSAQPLQLSTTLSGANEVPRPGDPNATGSASLVVDPSIGGLCSACHEGIDAGLLSGTAIYPFAYYVNVHTVAFPDGAARGQLQAASADSGAVTQ